MDDDLVGLIFAQYLKCTPEQKQIIDEEIYQVFLDKTHGNEESFEQWGSKNDTGRSSEDAAFESLSEHYCSALASKKLDLILENCFEKPTDEDCDWVRN
ncbi:hypothetical protein L1D55_26245 [Vibrio sp. Isolate22]|uniref:hypothetical protein n=1 Tax=Vibrio sp. Isolate22 TaxID=2908532 RepID=UPI001EFC5556|nr:hypothetical protein [Vibrio sp. Isolate22]MCG9695162.1 hypothetical protein [Vibrio sp. Isolate22]